MFEPWTCDPVTLSPLPAPDCIRARPSQVMAVLIKPDGVARPTGTAAGDYDAIINNAVTDDSAAKWLQGVGEVEDEPLVVTLGKDERRTVQHAYRLRLTVPASPNQHYNFLRVLQKDYRPFRFWFFTRGGSVVGGQSGIRAERATAAMPYPAGGHEDGILDIYWRSFADPDRFAVGPVSGGPDPTPPVITSYMFYRQAYQDQGGAVLTWTENAGVLPTTNTAAQVWVFQDGRKIWPSLQYAVSHNTGPGESEILVDSNTHYSGASYEVIAVITS